MLLCARACVRVCVFLPQSDHYNVSSAAVHCSEYIKQLEGRVSWQHVDVSDDKVD